MGKRLCEECGRDMAGFHSRAKVCSYACRQEKKKRVHRERMKTDPEYAEHSREIRRRETRKLLATAEGRKRHREKNSKHYWKDVQKSRAYYREYYRQFRLTRG